MEGRERAERDAGAATAALHYEANRGYLIGYSAFISFYSPPSLEEDRRCGAARWVDMVVQFGLLHIILFKLTSVQSCSVPQPVG